MGPGSSLARSLLKRMAISSLAIAMQLLRLLCLMLGCFSFAALAEVPEDARASVLEVRAYHDHGRTVFGSAVVIGRGKLVTNSHVTHAARHIEVVANGRVWPVTLTAHDSVRDLCLLDAPGVEAPTPVWSSRLEPGEKVYAAGFAADQGFTVSDGHVIALHDYDGAQVVQVSTPFEYGSSGGGLFNKHGRLVGILAFKARAGGPFHFALPVAWITQTGTSPEATASTAVAFWQRESKALPYFLRAVALEASRNWAGLATLAQEWVRAEPANQGAWRTWSKVQSLAPSQVPAAKVPAFPQVISSVVTSPAAIPRY